MSAKWQEMTVTQLSQSYFLNLKIRDKKIKYQTRLRCRPGACFTNKLLTCKLQMASSFTDKLQINLPPVLLHESQVLCFFWWVKSAKINTGEDDLFLQVTVRVFQIWCSGHQCQNTQHTPIMSSPFMSSVNVLEWAEGSQHGLQKRIKPKRASHCQAPIRTSELVGSY